jgi:hypothetical protein
MDGGSGLRLVRKRTGFDSSRGGGEQVFVLAARGPSEFTSGVHRHTPDLAGG